MESNPYSAPKAAIAHPVSPSRRVLAAIAPATLSFLAIPLLVVALSLLMRVPFPSFLTASGFLATLALCSIVASLGSAWLQPEGWLRFVVSPVVTSGLLAGVVVMLVGLAR